MSILGIDIGTSGTKVIAFNHSGAILSSNYIEYDTLFIKEGWIELNPAKVIESALLSFKKVVKDIKKMDPVEVVGISCLGSILIPVNKKNDYLYNGMTFMDSRTVDDIENKIGMDALELYKITGTPLNPFFFLNKLLWLKENKKEIFNSIHKFYSIKELLLLKLGIDPKIDHSLASSTMIYDLNREDWAEKLLKNIEVSKNLFPEIVNSWEIIGEIDSMRASELSLNKNVKIIAGGVDTGTCPFGVGVYKTGFLSNTIGTFEEAVVISKKLILNKNMMEKGILFSKNIIPDTYLAQGFPTTGGYVLKWFKNQFCKPEEELAKKQRIDVYDLVLKDMDKIDTNMLFLPHLSGSGTPNIDENSRGAFLNISANSSKEEFIKSIIEGLNFEIKLAIDFFEKEFGFIDRVHVTGGATKSDIWMQIKSDVLNKEIIYPLINEAGCLGISMLSAYASGIYKTIDEAVKNMFKIKRTYKSHKGKTEYYKNKFKTYEKLYRILKMINN